MTATLLELYALYGLPLAALCLALAQFGAPLPTSLLLLMIGALSAQGDTDLMTAAIWAVAGTVLGDQAGFALGRLAISSARGSQGRLSRIAARAKKAEAMVDKWGGLAVFFTRWLFTPFGSAVNFVSGASGLSWRVFTLWDLAGEIVWIVIYVGIGSIFSNNIETLGQALTNLSMALALLAVAALLGWRLRIAMRAPRAGKRRKSPEPDA